MRRCSPSRSGKESPPSRRRSTHIPDRSKVEEALERQAQLSEVASEPSEFEDTAPVTKAPEIEQEPRAPLPKRTMGEQEVKERMRGAHTIRMSGPPRELRLSGEPDTSSPPSPGRKGGSRSRMTDLGIMSDMLLGEVLLRLGYVSREQLQRGLRMQRASGTRIGEALVEIGAVDWDQIREGVRIQTLHRDSPAGFKKKIEL